jgi:hypothetical protein
MIDKTEGKLEEAKAYALTIQDTTLAHCLASLKRHDEHQPMEPRFYNETELFNDGDKSFYFVRKQIDHPDRISNGGVIFHDYQKGDNMAHIEIDPDFSKPHWSIHT